MAFPVPRLRRLRQNDQLREGDSGSALYAGSELVGLVTAVDTKTKQAKALTQAQIHGLFGADVLPGATRTALLKPLTVRKAENPYATAAAHDYLTGTQVQVINAGADGKPPQGTEYLIAGTVVDVTTSRIPPLICVADVSTLSSVGERFFLSSTSTIAHNDARTALSESVSRYGSVMAGSFAP
jgi:hypothetical protein